MGKNTEKLKVIDRDLIKYIAVIPMAIGHFIGSYYGSETGPDNSVLLFLLAHMALIAPPVFFFFIAEGFRYTRSRKKYALRLLSFAIITQIPFCLSENGTLLTTDLFFYLNIFFTLFLGMVSLMICESRLNKAAKAALIVLLDVLTLIFQSQWFLFGIPIIFAFYKFRDRPGKRLLCFTVCVCLMLLISYIQYEPLLGSVCFAADLGFLMLGYIIATVFYNGNKGTHPRFSKWFFYLFYPFHLLLIYLAKLLAGKF